MANSTWKQITQKAKDTWKAAYEKELQNFISGASGTAQKRYGSFEQNAKANPNAALQYLTSNQMMKPKTLADYHADDVRLAGTDRAAYARQLREQGVFDTEDNAYGGYAHNVSTPYLQNLLDAAKAKLADSVQADKAYADNMAAWRGENEKAYRQRQMDETAFNNWVAMSKYEGKDFSDPDYDPSDEDMLRLSNLINGTDYKNIVDMQQRMGLDEDSYSDEWDKMVDLWYAQDWANPALPAYTGMAEPETYNSMTGEWEDRIGTLQGELNRRTLADNLEAEAAAMPSYAELSVYQDNASDGTTGNAFVDFWNKPRTTYVGKYEDKNYFINNPIAEWQKAGAQEYSMAVQAYLNAGLDQLTAYERGVYNAFVNSGMQDKADEYLKSIEPLLLQRRAEAQDVKNELLATNPWTAVPAAVAAVGGDILSGAMAPIQLAGEALGMVDGPYDAIYDINRASATTTGAQMQAIGEADPLKDVKLFGKTPLQNLFAGFKGAATNLGRAALGPGTALALAGGQAVSGSLYENAGREDMPNLAQATQALLDGLVEVGTEKIGLDAFFNKGLPGAKEYVKQLVLSEMGEEALAYLGGEAIDHAVSEVFGHKGQYATGEELWQGLGETLLSTVISSGMMAAPGATQIRNQNKAAGKGISSNDSIAQVLEIADSMDKSSASYAEAQNVKAAMEGGKKVSLNKLGRLANAMQKELGDEYGKVIGRVADDTIVERMVELGDSKDVAQKNVQAVKKAAQGQNLTAQERADLTESSTAIQVVEELAGAAETSGEMAVKMQTRTMEAAAGIRSKQLGLQEAVRGKQAEKDVFAAEDDNASAKMVQAKPGTGAVTFLGEASSNQQVTGSGTEAALTNRMRSMTASQRNTVNGIKAIAKATGVNMVLFESTKEGRAAGVQNGSFVRGTNTIYLDINAGISTEAGMKGAKESGVLGYAMIRTLSHELTHFIEGNSKEGYDALMEQAKREFAAKGKDWDKLVVAKAKMSAAQGEKLTRTGAEAEVLADACEMMLQDTAAIERLARQNPSLKEKIAGFIKSFVQKIQKALRAIGAGSAEAKTLMEMRDGLMQYSEELTRLWGAGLEEAVGNAQSVEQQAVELSDVNTQFSIRDDFDASADGTDIDTSTDSAYQQYSIRTWAESDYVAKREEAIDRLVNTLHVEREKAAKWIDDVNSISAIILDNKARLDYIPTAVEGVSAFKSNPEYGGSIDMSTICAKRRLATGTLDAIQNALGDAALTKDDFLHIREMMKERGHEVACGLCFVESSRKNLSKYTKQFLDQFNATHPDNQVSMTDFNTVDGLERTRLLNQEAYAEYEKFMNKLAQRKPKLFEKRTEYRHEILQKFKKDTTVGAKNINGGLRLQSFSDFEIVHLIDMMQVITDMASVGLAGQAYTKVPDFAWALGDTGLKINLSLIAKDVDEDGNLIFDDVEGMNHEEAKRLRDAYSENVGTIVVAFTDEQIMAAMKSDFVDFIIPFHRSQWQKSDYKKLGLPEGTKDYTMHQNEKLGRKRVKDNYMPNDYWDFSKTGKQNAQKYLDKCSADGRTPKFAKFLQNNGDGTYSMKADGSTDGYWKLLIDFKMYDNNGVGSPQNPVQPNFNMDEARRMLDTYNGIHDSFPVAQDVVDDFVKEYQGNKGGIKLEGGRVTLAGRQMSRRATDAEYMQAVERGDMATAQRMVDEAAKAAGYEPVKQYHGTRNFGFKKFDLNRMDDKISIFVTDNRRIAESYSRENADLPLKDAQNMDRYDFMQQPSKLLEPYVRKHLTTRLRVPTEREMREHTDRESAYILSSTDWVTDYFAAHEDSLDRETLQALYNIMYYGAKLAAIPTANLEDETDGYKLRMKYDDAVYDLSWANRDVYDELSSVIGRTVTEAANKLISARFSDPFYDESIGDFVNKWDVTDKLGEKLFSGIYELYGDQKNLLEIDAKDANWNKIDGALIDRPGVWVTTRDVAEYAKARGYNGARIKDLRDSGGLTAYSGASTITIYFDNTSLKSADPVTYDDDGNVIPLSERFTRSETDIRYSQRLPDDISTREYLADADSSIAANAEQANALEIYKTRIAAYREATRAVDQAKAALAATTDRDESIKARNRLELLQKQQSRAYDQLIAAEDTKHIRELTGATTEFIQKQLAGKTEADIASMIAEAESEIASLTEQLSGLKGASREQTDAVKEQIRMLKARVTRLRNSATRKLLETRQHYQEMFQRDRARREINAEASKKANHIKAVVKRLNDRIVNESDYKNVKEGMKPAVQDLVRTFIDGFGNLVFDQRKADRLRAVYDKLAAADSDESAFYSDDVAAMINELAELAGEDEARRKAPTGTLMDNAEKKLAIYSRVADIADNIWHMVQTADEIFVNGKRERFATLGNATGEAMLAKADYKQLYGLPGRLQKWNADLIRNGNMIPTYFFESLGNSGMQSLFDGIMSAQTGYSAAILAGQRAMQDAKRRYHYAAWQDQKPVEITTSQGHKVRLTVEQMMSLYATAKREASNELMQTHHLEIGGFKLEGEQRAAENGKGKWIAASSQAHRLTEADVTKITNTLTAEQRAYADEMVKYLSEDMAELGNKASMEMFGIRKYQEKYYFPFKTASENRYQKSNAGNLSTTDDARLKHSSFTHRLTKGANTTLVIGDFSNVIADHINHMATYANFVSPIESMNRVLNYKVEEEDGNVTAIRALLGRKYGESSQNYVQTLLKDLNGGVQTDSRGAGAVNALISAFKRGAVASSLSVAVQQPTAYLKAFGYISPKYFAHLTGEGHKAAWEEAMRYSGTAVIKDMGKFDLGLGQTANEWIGKADESELALWERFKAYWPWTKDSNWTTAKAKWNGLLSALPGWMDQVTWTHIWKAVKAEQADLHPGVDTSSEAFLRLCGMRFDEVINHTQVYDSVLSRSNLMRSSNSLHKMATAFMAEPTLTANIMHSAVRGNHTMAERARMIGSALGSSLLAAAFAAAISAWNDDEDDRPAAEKYLDKFSALAFDNLNPAGWIPYISDVSSMLEGYDVERADMSVISDMVQYSEKFFAAIKDGRMPTWKESENYIGTMLNLLGVPAKNISRDIRRIRNAATTTWEGTTAANIGFTVLENLPYGAYDGSNTAYYERYAAALIGGDKQKAYNIKDYLLSSKGVKEDNFKNKAKTALGEAYNAGKMDEDTAKQLLVANGLAKNAKEAFQVVDKWEEGGAKYSAYNTVKKAFAADDEKAVQEAIAELKANGYTGEEISNYLKNQKVIREAVEKGQISPERATYYLRKYAPYKNDKDNVSKPKEWAGKQ